MAHLQYMPGDPRLVDQLVYELKSKGIFDQFRKECIADVDTRPAYQNLRQRVENSVTTFLSRQTWQPDMNKNQLREKLRKHILDGNYLEQGVERIVDQVVNPKVATVFIPKVEDLVYTVLGITRKKSPPAETSNGKVEDLLPNDLEAVSPGSVKSNEDKNEHNMDVDSLQDSKMEIDEEKSKSDTKDDSIVFEADKENTGDIQLPSNGQNDDIDKSNIPLPSEEIKPENIPSPDTSPPKVELEKIELPKEPIISTDIPLPNDICKEEKDQYFKPLNSEDDDSSSDSSLRRNMSPLTPIRNFNNENSCDAQQAFENDSIDKSEDKKEPSSFRFKLDAKSSENSLDTVKPEAKKEAEINLSYQFNSQVNINNFNTPLYEDSSNSNNLQIDYESDANSKAIIEAKVPENDQILEESKKEKKSEEKKSSHKSSHRSRDSHKHSTSKDKKSDSKHSNSRDSSRHDKSKSSKEDSKSKSSEKDKSKDKNEKKNTSRDSSSHRSSHKSSHKDSKSHRSSSSTGRPSSKHSDDKKSSSSSSNHKDKDKSTDKSKDSKSSSHRSDKDRKSSSSSRSDKTSSKSKDDKDKDKKSKKENDDHYSLSGRGNPNRRSTDRDSNDGSTSSKGSHNPSSSKSSNSKKDSKSSSKSESTSTSDSTSPSDKENIVRGHSSKTKETLQHKPIVRIERQLEMAVTSPPRLPFVPDVTIKKPKFAANLQEAKRLMKMRKFLDEEQKRMNQEAALLLEFQANVRPSMSQVYSSIPGPELEFACVSNIGHSQEMLVQSNDNINHVSSDGHNNINVLNQIVDERHVLNPEHDVDNVLSEEHNINNDVSHSTDGNIEKAHYTNNELLTVLNDAKDDRASNSIDYEMLIDNVNKTNTPENIQDAIKTLENNEKINNSDVQTSIEMSEINQTDNNIAESVESFSSPAEELCQENKVSNIEKEVINEKLESTDIVVENKETLTEVIATTPKQDSKKLSNLFEVTIITEELSETEEGLYDYTDTESSKVDSDINEEVKTHKDETTNKSTTKNKSEDCSKINGENELHYFGEHEKYNAELERAQFNNFFKEYNTKTKLNNKLYLINCDSYEENVVREASKELGDYEIVSYHKNGHLKLPINKNVIKNVNISTEISLPMDAEYEDTYDSENITHNAFNSEKSECSFELSSDYDSKLEEMVNRTSRQEIMEIILGNVIDTSPSKMPRIDYLNDSNIDSEYENGLKRKICEISEETTTSVNNNRPVLTPNKIRKLSTDQITSTTQENEEISNNKTQNITRSKYLGKARRVGLPRPKRTILPNSPSSDKSVENYEQNTPTTPNGKLKRSKVQRYDTSDLYKPKLHYLSRRNHVT